MPLREDRQFTHEEAQLLDLCMVLHAEHGGGNNSTFTTRVLSSAQTDIYSTIAAAIGSRRASVTAARTTRYARCDGPHAECAALGQR